MELFPLLPGNSATIYLNFEEQILPQSDLMMKILVILEFQDPLAYFNQATSLFIDFH